jgi:hypothetical protein
MEVWLNTPDEERALFIKGRRQQARINLQIRLRHVCLQALVNFDNVERVDPFAAKHPGLKILPNEPHGGDVSNNFRIDRLVQHPRRLLQKLSSGATGLAAMACASSSRDLRASPESRTLSL